MSNCPISADEGRYAREQGIKEAYEIEVESLANGMIEQAHADLLSARRNPEGLSSYYILQVSKDTLALIQLVFSESDELYGLAESLAKQDIENRDEI